MRAVVTVAAVAIFAAGFAWRVVGRILAWVGWALGVRGIASTYQAFVESYVGMAANPMPSAPGSEADDIATR